MQPYVTQGSLDIKELDLTIKQYIFFPSLYLVLALASDLSAQICPTITIDQAINDTIFVCGSTSGGPIDVSASIDLDPAAIMSVSWLPSGLFSDPQSLETTIQVTENNETMVAIEYRDTNLVINGDFENGDDGSFRSDYSPFDLELFAGTYKIGNSPNQGKPEWEDCANQDGGRSNMFLSNASGNVEDAVWCQTIQVKENIEYVFNAEFVSARYKTPFFDNLILPELEVRINGVSLTDPISAPRGRCDWTDFGDLIWNSENAASAEICIYNRVDNDDDNDFALDNISFRHNCRDSASVQFIFSELDASFSPPAHEFCLLDQKYPLSDWLEGRDSTGQWIVDGVPSEIFNPMQSGIGKHYIQYTLSDARCDVSHLDSVIVRAEANATFAIQSSICSSGDAIPFDSISVNTQEGIWRINGMISSSFSPSEYTPGDYEITYQVGQSGCEDSSSQMITLHANPLFDLPPEAILSCTQPQVELLEPSGFSLDYSIIFDDGTTAEGSQDIPFSLDTSGIYEITVTDPATGCLASDDIAVSDTRTFPEPTFELREVPCNHLDTLIITGTTEARSPIQYSLDSIAFQEDPIFANLTPGEYNVHILDAQGCRSQTPLVILPKENVSVTLELGGRTATPINAGDTVLLRALLDGDESVVQEINWSPTTSACATCIELRVTPIVSAIYRVEVIDQNGCTTSDSLLLDVITDHEFFVPNAFTPNGDGINESFTIDGPTLVAIQEIRIWDRWGNQVYMQKDLLPGEILWDGKVHGGSLHPGAFVYAIEILRLDGMVEKLAGSVSVLR